MSMPKINTAIPQRRYQLGEFTIIVLGDIQSGDGKDYKYIMAVVREGDPEPGLSLTLDNRCEMRLVMRDGEDSIGESRDWASLDAFVKEGLSIVARVLKLTDETPYPL